MNWKRYIFNTFNTEDNKPLIFNKKYPWWWTGYGENENGDFSVIIAYLPSNEDLLKYWDDAFDIEFTEEDEITFTERFTAPNYFEPD